MNATGYKIMRGTRWPVTLAHNGVVSTAVPATDNLVQMSNLKEDFLGRKLNTIVNWIGEVRRALAHSSDPTSKEGTKNVLCEPSI